MVAEWILPFLFMVVADVPKASEVEERVDLIELNHFYDDLGRHVYDQLIFYEWAPDAKHFLVRAWCLVDEKQAGTVKPWRSWPSREWNVRYHDRENRVLRKITSKQFRETWTQVDPERANRKLLDERLRTALANPGVQAVNTNTVRR
jgi:hypothetical protein